MRSRTSRVARLLGVLTALLLLGTTPEDPVDVIAYADHLPQFFQPQGIGPAPFATPFCDGPAGSCVLAPNATRIRLAEVPGIRHPVGTEPWGHATWSKYVLVGNYDERSTGIFQTVEDQRIGLFDIEARTFCEIDLEPGIARNAAVQWLTVASPSESETRIYFSGFTTGAGYVFGYLEADAANPTPCDPVTGWNVVGFTRDELNCRAAGLPLGCAGDGLPAEEKPCVTTCAWDDLVVLDPETNVLGNWIESRFVVAKVDAAGVLTVPSVYPIPLYEPGGETGEQCYTMRPVSRSQVDPTRTSGDLRWTSSMDISCDMNGDVPGCAPHVDMCPVDADAPANPDLACPPSGVCDDGYCEVQFANSSYVGCATTADCAFDLFGTPIDLGECVFECAKVHPGFACSDGLRAGAPCRYDGQCPKAVPSDDGKCICDGPTSPAQEYRFDGTDIASTSRFFRSAADRNSLRLAYDSSGRLWTVEIPGAPPSGGQARIQLYHRIGSEHTYYAPGDPAGAAIVPPNDDSMTLTWEGVHYPEAIESGSAMYITTPIRLQRAIPAFGQWIRDSSYDLTLGYHRLPSEARFCSPPGPFESLKKGCVENSDCAVGQTCIGVPVGQTTPMRKANLTAGGSPPSLWMTMGFQGAGIAQAVKNLYLLRVPLATAIPDSVVVNRPAIAWNAGDCASHPRQCRLWGAALRDGAMRFRIRDDGFWSGWHTLPSAPVTGGPAIVALGNGVEVYARGSTDGLVRRTQLTSPATCEPASCTWSAWETLPGSPLTESDVAAAAGGGKKLVAIRRKFDNRVYVTLDSGGGWSSWVMLDGFQTGQAPSATYHAADGKFWLAAATIVVKTIQVTAFDGSAPQPWSPVETAGTQAPWQTGPAIASDGARVHLYAPRSVFPQELYHAIHNGSGWGGWRRLVAGAATTWQPAATSATGEIQLVTGWPNAGLTQQATD
jgi:hypothetical protein